MSIRFGVAPIAWSNDDLPQLGGETSLETCLDEAAQIGYAGVEKGGKFPMDASLLRPLLEERNLALCSGWFSGGLLRYSIDEEKSRIKSQLELYQALEAPVMVYAETTGSVQAEIDVPLSRRPALSADDIKRYGETLTKFAEWLRDEGCPMSYHHHMGTVIETEDEVDRLMAASDVAVGLLLDTGHLAFAGGDPLATTARHATRINHIHCKDVRERVVARAKAEDWSFLQGVLEGVFTVPGDGMIDFGEFAKVVRSIDYSGWVVVEAEQDPAKANPYAMGELGLETLREAFANARLDPS